LKDEELLVLGPTKKGHHISLGFIGRRLAIASIVRQVDSSADVKAGPEAHFLAGQIFTLGIAAIAVVPRMPSDSHIWAIGGKLSFPFRRSLLGLIILGLVRAICFHVRPIDANEFLLALDGIFGTIHVIGQSFLCLTTAYLLQRQLVNYINLEGGAPGRNLVPYLLGVSGLTVTGALGSRLIDPTYLCLVNLAEALSCYPVLQTLRLYTSITTRGSSQVGLRAPVLTQMLTVTEYWYLTTSLLSFVAEALDESHGNLPDQAEGHFWQLLSIAVRHNQDNGVDDWTRLLLHAVFLNSLDELHHVVPPEYDGNDEEPHTTTTASPNVPEEMPTHDALQHPLVLRSRADRGAGLA
jgi:hypothetical protein